MNITKLGHCALILEDGNTKLLIDPGSYSAEAQQKVTGLSAILITHEHGDHLHIESVEALLKTNPGVRVISNVAVAKILEGKGIACEIVGDGQSTEINAMVIEGFGTEHAPIYATRGLCENTGYFVNNRFFFPGDNFFNPGKKVDVLALPIAGPWMKMAEAIEYAKEMQARVAVGVHDGMVEPESRSFQYLALREFVPETEFVELTDGETKEF